MSIPLDRLYHYIESVAQDVYGDTVIYHFYPHGSKNIKDLHRLRPLTLDQNLINPEIICYDQEPLNYDVYQNERGILSDPIFKTFYENSYQKIFDIEQYPKKNIRAKTCNLYDKAILLHSELNSTEVQKYQNHGEFIPVYYWCHAIIALDWFRYARHVKQNKSVKKDFLIYNRAWNGTREYRLKFADLLVDYQLVDQCQTSVGLTDQGVYYRDHDFDNPVWRPQHHLEHSFAGNFTTSCYSADFNISDYESTNIEVVLETLFDDSRLHLTEKSLRPIALGQPFILAGTMGSLNYLRNYGFKTFDKVFDETYDLVNDPFERLNCIVKTMQSITKWSKTEKQEKLTHAQEIANYNRQHFFSPEFMKIITDELQTNLSDGLNELISTNTGHTFLKLRHAPGLIRFIEQYQLSRLSLASYIKLARSWRNKSVK